MTARLMVYGANGYTARFVLDALRARGIPFLAAGRRADAVGRVARAFGVSSRVFDLTDHDAVARALDGVEVLLNAAGPFRETTAPLARGCLQSRTHYLDLSGEVAPLELVARLDEAARARDVMLLPAVGFDVVPSDCLAVHLAQKLPGAEELILSISGLGVMSRGSAITLSENAGVPALVRRAGSLEALRYRNQARWTDFGDGARLTIASTWGDLVTAFRSTRIPKIEVYFDVAPLSALALASSQYMSPLLGPLARTLFRSLARLAPEQPARNVVGRHSARILGEARAGEKRVRTLLRTSDVYSFSGVAAAAVVERVLGGTATPGFHTPGTLLGPDFPLSIGATRKELS